MEQWEIDLREKLNEELPEGIYIIEIGKMKMTTGKQGQIEYEVALIRAMKDSKNLSIIEQAEKWMQYPNKTYERLTEQRLKDVLNDVFNKHFKP